MSRKFLFYPDFAFFKMSFQLPKVCSASITICSNIFSARSRSIDAFSQILLLLYYIIYLPCLNIYHDVYKNVINTLKIMQHDITKNVIIYLLNVNIVNVLNDFPHESLLRRVYKYENTLIVSMYL